MTKLKNLAIPKVITYSNFPFAFNSSTVITWWTYKDKNMKLRKTIFCESCNSYLKNMTKKKFYYHQQYHTGQCFSCEHCKSFFDSEALLNFHILKKHQYILKDWYGPFPMKPNMLLQGQFVIILTRHIYNLFVVCNIEKILNKYYPSST